MTFQVTNEEIRKVLNQLGKFVGDSLPKGWGFSLLIFDYQESGQQGSMFYLSNANRKDMLEAMKEFIKKNENA